MPTHAVQSTHWTTAAFPDSTQLMPAELKALGAHVVLCRGERDPWFRLKCAAEAVHSFIAPRFVTTLAIVLVTFGVSATML